MSRYYNDYIAHSTGPWKKHKYLKKVGNGPKALYVYARDRLNKAYKTIGQANASNKNFFAQRHIADKQKAISYTNSVAAKQKYRAAALKAKKKAAAPEAKKAVDDFLEGKKKEQGGSSAVSEEEKSTSKKTSKKKSSSSKKKSTGTKKSSSGHKKSSSSSSGSSKKSSSRSSDGSSKSKQKSSKQVKALTEKTKLTVSQIEDDDEDISLRKESDSIPDTNFYLFQGKNGHFVLTDSDSTKWDLPVTTNITEENKAEISERLKTLTNLFSNNTEEMSKWDKDKVADVYEKSVVYAFRGQMDKAKELVITGKISRKKSSSVAHGDDLVEQWMMSRYYNDDFIEHSSGPWKKHKYISKKGSGANAVYVYAKKAGKAVERTLGDPDLPNKINNKIDEGERRGEDLDRRATRKIQNTYQGAKNAINRNRQDARNASKQISNQQYAADRKVKNKINSTKNSAKRTYHNTVQEAIDEKNSARRAAKRRQAQNEKEARDTSRRLSNQQYAADRKVKNKVNSAKKKANNAINRGDQYGKSLDRKATNKIQNTYQKGKNWQKNNANDAKRVSKQYSDEQYAADRKVKNAVRSTKKKAKKSYKALKQIWGL